MSEERVKVLEALGDGQITVGQAFDLLDALGRRAPLGPVGVAGGGAATASHGQAAEAPDGAPTAEQLIAMRHHGVSPGLRRPLPVRTV